MEPYKMEFALHKLDSLKRRFRKITIDVIDGLSDNFIQFANLNAFIIQDSEVENNAAFIKFRADKPWYIIVRGGSQKQSETLFESPVIRIGVYDLHRNSQCKVQSSTLETFFESFANATLENAFNAIIPNSKGVVWLVSLLKAELTKDILNVIYGTEFFEERKGYGSVSIMFATNEFDIKKAAKILFEYDPRTDIKEIRKAIQRTVDGNGRSNKGAILMALPHENTSGNLINEPIAALCLSPFTKSNTSKVYHQLISMAVIPQFRRKTIGTLMLTSAASAVSTYIEAWIPCMDNDSDFIDCDYVDYANQVQFFSKAGCKISHIKSNRSPYPDLGVNMIRALLLAIVES
jgi:hypothetical protein